ncbi:MAG: hypothetical protein FIA96_01950, partial [Betaproteobacteria bacterium]|nr:hypothetical protein [Betaproteobacteria bacterium]
MKTCSNLVSTSSSFCRLNRICAIVSAIAFAVLPLHPTLSAATLPPGEAAAVEWPDDPVDGWIGESASELLPDLIGRAVRPLTKEEKYDFINDALESSQHTVVWQEQYRTEHGTIAIPRLEGDFARTLEPDGSLTLRFDKPVGQIQVGCQAQFSVKADSTHQVFRLEARNYEQGRIYPVQIRWRTTTGDPLPPLNLQLTTPPPLFVSVNTEGLTNLGLA